MEIRKMNSTNTIHRCSSLINCFNVIKLHLTHIFYKKEGDLAPLQACSIARKNLKNIFKLFR
jgi:hypothetical protein